MEPPVLEFWKNLRICPAKWNLSPWGEMGGGFWVVAVIGDRCFWYNDIEEGFNIGRYEHTGATKDGKGVIAPGKAWERGRRCNEYL
jgi:hypothetical protein